MRKYLLPKEGQFYKANMHTHTTVSDGQMTPAEIKKVYQDHGYSIVAFTDHDVFVPHHDLTDDKFLALAGVEVAVSEDIPDVEFASQKTYHLNFYARSADITEFPLFSEKRVGQSIRGSITPEMLKYDYRISYGQEDINKAIRFADDCGFFASYNHPVWSMQTYKDYGDLENVWGVEVFNSGCFITGRDETIIPWEDLLRQGKKPFPLATDDAHTLRDCCGGFLMVKAKELTYPTVIQALEKGDFYATTGPRIYELWLEGTVLHISCSPAQQVNLTAENRWTHNHFAMPDLRTEINMDISTWFRIAKEAKEKLNRNSYFRITVKDQAGKAAYTRAYFYDELVGDEE
ncbi:MAG: hypothetical protein E7363_01465 [Clostridiales bacterium]|nr:hypothetical protein [Clostridiales bacterium]